MEIIKSLREGYRKLTEREVRGYQLYDGSLITDLDLPRDMLEGQRLSGDCSDDKEISFSRVLEIG